MTLLQKSVNSICKRVSIYCNSEKNMCKRILVKHINERCLVWVKLQLFVLDMIKYFLLWSIPIIFLCLLNSYKPCCDLLIPVLNGISLLILYFMVKINPAHCKCFILTIVISRSLYDKWGTRVVRVDDTVPDTRWFNRTGTVTWW